MKAIVQTGYGSPTVLGLSEIPTPEPGDNEVLVRVHAAAIHAGDFFAMRGVPVVVRLYVGLPRPKGYVQGQDAAGTVQAVGQKVTRFKPGDEVFGPCGRACAEYACAAEDRFVPKPESLTFAQAAAMPTSALAALQGLRDAGRVRQGQRVLINGASGGVGTFAVQIAKAFGAETTGVCSTRNVDMVRSIGADHVIDYTHEDFTETGQTYDLILDNVGNRSFAECRHALTPNGSYLPNTGNAGLSFVLSAFLRSIVVHQQGRPFFSMPNHGDLVALKEMTETGRVTPVIDRTYDLDETPRALAYLGEGHARGKVVIAV